MRKVRAGIAGLLVAAFVLQPGMATLPPVRAEAASTPTPDAVPTAAATATVAPPATATPTPTPSIPNLPSLAAPVVSSVGATFASVTLPAKPDGFDSYGNQFYVKLFTAVNATSGEIVLGGWQYSYTPWGTLQATSGTALLPGTNYWARFWLRDNLGREVLSDAASFTTLATPALPTLPAPVVSQIGGTYASVTLPANLAGFDNYGNQFYVKLFTAADASSGESVLGGWAYAATPWGTLQATSNTALLPGTTYWARFWLRDNFGRTVLSDAASFTTLGSPLPSVPALDAPVVTAVLPDNVMVRWPAKPAWFDDDTMTEITLVACPDAEPCSSNNYAVYRLGPAIGGSRKIIPWGVVGQWAESNGLKLSTAYWLRYLVTTRWGAQSWSPATHVVTGSAPELPALDAPVVTAVLPDNVMVRWPAKPAWFDDDTMTEITLVACPDAEPCSSNNYAVYRLGQAIGGSRKIIPWGVVGQFAESNGLKLSTAYWLRYVVTTRWGAQSWSPATHVVTGALPALAALDAPVLAAVLPDNVMVRWPAKPAWFDDDTMTEITLVACPDAEPCSSNNYAVYRLGPAIGGSRKIIPWGVVGQFAESNGLKLSTAYWLRYVVTTRWGAQSWSPATTVVTGSAPELPALDAPVVTAVLPDNVMVRWPAKPAWFDDDTMTEITLVACPVAEPCSSNSYAVYRLGPAIGGSRKIIPWGVVGQFAESNGLKLSTAYWLRYVVTTRWGAQSWSPAAYIVTGVALPGAGTAQPTASPSATPTLTSTPTPTITLTPAPSLTPTQIPGLGGYAVIHPDGNVCGVIVATSANPFGNGGTMPVEYMGCPVGSRIIFQTKPSPTGNVAGWHGANVTYSNGVFTITNVADGKVAITIKDGIATDADGRVWDTGSSVVIATAVPTQTQTPTASPSPTLTATLAPSLTPTAAAAPLLKLPVTQTFGDVPPTHPYFAYIEALYRAGYTAGCSTSPLLYCPERSMTRAEGAVFVMRGHRGAAYQALAPAKSAFADVDVANWSAKWAAALQSNGLTAGCSAPTVANPLLPLLYCPWQGHTRVEGAVFYMRVMRGAAYTPPAATGMFVDLDPAWWGTKWAEAAYTAGIAPACSSAPLKYCASAPLTRDVAAFMLVGAKNLPLQ